MASSPTCLDLFSGAGGLSLGFLLAGGRPIGCVDFDQDSVDTYQSNFVTATETSCASISDWTPSRRLKGVDAVIGGPPCQGFSLARGTRFIDDPRNHLYRDFVRVVNQLQPKFVVMENVEGILSIGDGRIVAQVIEDFERVGYSIDHKTFNMAEYGVAQTRRRTIFVAFRSGKSVRWPELTHALRSKIPKNHPSSPDLPLAVSVNEALSDLKLPIGNFFAHRANSQMRGPRNRDANRDPAFTLRVRGDEFALCEEPATGAFIPDTRVGEPTRRYLPKNAFQVLMQEPSPWRDKGELKTLVRRQRQPVNGSRFLTLREQSRLQSFPDWFEFKGRRTSVAKQIGNAVPPVFAARLFAALIEQI